MPAVIAAISQCLHLQLYTFGAPITACIDTGADCSLLTENAYQHLKNLYNVPLFKQKNELVQSLCQCHSMRMITPLMLLFL